MLLGTELTYTIIPTNRIVVEKAFNVNKLNVINYLACLNRDG